jgi:DHA2 family multidrug resistance protein
MVVGVVLLVVWVVRSLHIPNALIELRMFTIPAFSLTMVIVWLVTISQFARLVFIPLEFETLRGFDALSVGLMLTPAALGVAVTMPIGGRLADRIGARVPVTIGLVVTACSFWPLGHLHADSSETIVALWLFVGGLGVGLSMMPNTVIAMNSVHGRYVAQASAVRSLNRQIAASLGTAVLASVLASRIGVIGSHAGKPTPHVLAGYNDLFLIAMYFSIAAFVCALGLPGKRGAQALQEERRREGPVAGVYAEFE